MPATTTEVQECKAEIRNARKTRRKSEYLIQINMDADGWEDWAESADKQFPNDASARKFVRDGQHVGKFRVIRVVSEFTSAIEERKVVKLT